MLKASPLDFNEAGFRDSVAAALKAARTVLDVERNPRLPEDQPHSYSDKFVVCNVVTNTALSSALAVLEALGVHADALSKILGWHSEKRAVTLRWRAEERCTFVREATREVESAVKHVVQYQHAGINTGKRTDSTVTTVREWFWNFTCEHSLVVYAGSDVEHALVLQRRQGAYEVVTLSKEVPHPAVRVVDPLDLNLTWMLSQIAQGGFVFAIDRAAATTHTPRRNAQVDEALAWFSRVWSWASSVRAYYVNTLFPIHVNHGLDVDAASNNAEIVIPVLPLMEGTKRPAGAAEDTLASAPGALVAFRVAQPGGPLLASADLALLLANEKRAYSDKQDQLRRMFPAPADERLISAAEVLVVLGATHLQSIAVLYGRAVGYLEALIRKQLVAAIGKEVTPVDFASYMDFHYRKMYRPEFQPRPFCYAVRRPDHYPEGEISIEARTGSDAMPEPIRTLVSRSPIHTPFQFNIHAAATVSFTGECFLHAYLRHEFSGDAGLKLTLCARARQFSSFLVLVGRIGGPTQFDPQYGMLVQNKDDVTIPLETETIPSVKEFKKAIQSISPEQQSFANMFRGMQLASTLFGVCVIQVKPQLERLLRLPDDGLTKEIRLTQDLMELFVKYQIPSDQLSYGISRPADAAPSVKVDAVKAHVAAMQEMIHGKKQEELKQVKQVASLPPPEPPKLVKPVKPSNLPVKSAAPRIQKGGGGGFLSFLSKTVFQRSEAPEPQGYGGYPGSASSSASAGMVGGDYIDASNSMVAVDADEPMMMMAASGSAAEPAPKPVFEEAAGEGGEAPAEEAADDDGPKKDMSLGFESGASQTAVRDLTAIPKELEAKMEKLDADGALRPTVINVGTSWTKRAQKSLLTPPGEPEAIAPAQQRLDKQACYDLLDALTCSGSLDVRGASLHVVIASTHCFDKNVMNTLVQDNVNPIEKTERSSLLLATTIFARPAADIVQAGHAVPPQLQ